MTRFDPSSPGPLPPFWVALCMTNPASPSFSAVVFPGKVYERYLPSGLQTYPLCWEPDNLMSEDDATLQTRFPATVGYGLFVQVTAPMPAGIITSVTLVTGDKDGMVTSPGPNQYNYKLLEFADDGAGGIKLVPFLMGSNICHIPEGKALNLEVQRFSISGGALVYDGGDVTHYWRRGLYVGTVNPGDDFPPDEVQKVAYIDTYIPPPD